MSFSTWVSDFLRDLTQPKRIRPVLPPRPLEGADVARYLFTQTLLAELLAGKDSTFTDKAAFVLGPLAVNAAATWGANQGVKQLNQQNPGPRPGAIDI